MRYVYPYLIANNIAPPGATCLVALDASGNEVARIPLGPMTPPTEEPLYRFAVGADSHNYHVAGVAWSPNSKLDTALTRAEQCGCAFFILVGDVTQTGLYREADPDNVDTQQFDTLKVIIDGHEITVYILAGNHESYVNPVTDTLDLLQGYTGNGLFYKILHGDDVHLLLGQPAGTQAVSVEELQWLYEQLETHRNQRCFVYVHPYLTGGSGNPLGAHHIPIWDYTPTRRDAFKALLKHYTNSILFHGHSHTKWECQEQDDRANYVADDFCDVHVPSLGVPRDVVDGILVGRNDESYFYIVDVHDDCLVLRGINNITGQPVPIGTYYIPTPIIEVEAGTFTDPTGTIMS